MSTTEGRRSSDDLYATIGALACLIEDAAQTKRRLQLSIEVARLVEVVALLDAGYRNGKAVEQEAASASATFQVTPTSIGYDIVEVTK